MPRPLPIAAALTLALGTLPMTTAAAPQRLTLGAGLA